MAVALTPVSNRVASPLETLGDMQGGNGDELGKIFVGGLSWDTTHDSLLKYFSRYGEVIDCVVMKNQTTGKSRGFGFVKFREPNCVDDVLANGPHVLDGRQVDPKACNPRSLNKGSKLTDTRSKKIFVGGLPPNCNEVQLKEVFGQFGKVSDVVIMYDQQKQRSRGFGFLSFETEDGVERVCQQHFVQVGGKKVECKRAEPRDIRTMNDLGFKTSTGQALTLSAAGGLLQAGLSSGHLAFPGMHLPGSHLAGAGLAANPYGAGMQQGIAWLAAPTPLPLTLSAAGLHNMAATMNGTGIGSWPGQPGVLSEVDQAAWAHIPGVTTRPTFLPAHLAQTLNSSAIPGYAPASAYNAHTLAQVSAIEAQESGQGYLSPSPGPTVGSPGPPGTGDSPQPDKNGYVVYSPYTAQLGMLGNYPQEASSYGPSRTFLAAADCLPHSNGAPTPYTASVTYSPSPALAALQGAYATELANPYAGAMALPLAYGGQGDSALQAYAASLAPRMATSVAQGFHPYRR